ncbi:MAG: hypothetical protein ACLSVD_10070 [Eggerthellaceae bacterium]
MQFESQYYDGVAGSLPYAERTLARWDSTTCAPSRDAQQRPRRVSSLLVGSSDVAHTLATKTASDGDGKPVTLLFVGIRGTYGAEWLSNFNSWGRPDDADHRGFKAAEEERSKRCALRERSGIDPATQFILGTYAAGHRELLAPTRRPGRRRVGAGPRPASTLRSPPRAPRARTTGTIRVRQHLQRGERGGHRHAAAAFLLFRLRLHHHTAQHRKRHSTIRTPSCSPPGTTGYALGCDETTSLR